MAALACVAIVAIGLRLARDLIVPVVVAALLGFILKPSVARLERLRVRRGLAVAVVAGGAAIAALGVLLVVAIEIGTVAQAVPAYAPNIRAKISSLGIDQLVTSLERIKAAPKPAPAPEPGAAAAPDSRDAPHAEPSTEAESAVPVRVLDTPSGLDLDVLASAAAQILEPLIFLGLVFVVLVFLLLNWEDVRERAIRLISFNRLTLTTRAMDDVGRTISTVLRWQLAINTGVGLSAGLALWALGVPAAPLWGAMAVVLRFIPYAGIVVAAGMPVTVALVVSDGWSLPIMIAAVFLIIELIAGNFVEPVVLGGRAGISTLALLLSAAFWTWLWGLPGLFLATPITVGLAVIGRHVPQLQILDVLLGDGPVLDPTARLFQRLLVADEDDADRIARDYHAQHGLVALFDHLFMPALRQLERDQEAGLIEDQRAVDAIEILHELVDLAAERESPPDPPPVTPDPAATPILCLPARDRADALAGTMLVSLLTRSGRRAVALTVDQLGGDLAAIVRESGAEVVCISAVPPYAARHARIRRRQVHLRVPGATVFTGLWVGDKAGAPPTSTVPASQSDDPVITTLGQMVERLAQRSSTPGTAPAVSPPGSSV